MIILKTAYQISCFKFELFFGIFKGFRLFTKRVYVYAYNIINERSFMKKYIVLYHAPVGVMENMEDSTPEERKQQMELWKEWATECGDGLVDIGAPLGANQKVTKQGATAGASSVVGYSVLQAENMEVATEMLQHHPHLQWSDTCEIEVHETLPLPGM
jgi:hypothetical protein